MKQLTVCLVLCSLIGATAVVVAGDGRMTMGEAIRVWSVEQGAMIPSHRIVKSDDEWKKELEPEVYKVVRRHGTEKACSGAHWKNDREGVYRCVACGLDLFLSDTKYTSGTGWPSFFRPVHDSNIGTTRDTSWGMVRTEVHCERCGAHLGHVFDDGPPPTGSRYCINSLALEFVETGID